MKTRIISVVVFLAILMLFMVLGVYSRALFGLVCGIICTYEITKAVKKKHPTILPVFAYLFIAFSVVSILFEKYLWIIYGLFVFILLSFSTAVFSPKHKASDILALYGIILYPISLILVITYGLLLPAPYWYVILIIGSGSAAFCDAFALFGGMAFGKHKLAPLVSPKKTIEGSVSGSLSTLLLAVILYFVFKYFSIIVIPFWKLIVICFINSIVGQIGDLIASSIKREFEIKDYSNLIPGHGGLMDRLDSHFFTLPTTLFLFILFGLV